MDRRHRWNPFHHTRALERRFRAWRKGHPLPKSNTTVSVPQVIDSRLPNLRPLRFYSVPRVPRRVTVITDSIGQGSLYGGVGTAIVFSTLLARKLDAGLRFVTRTERPVEKNVASILSTHRVDWPRNVEFAFAGLNSPRDQLDHGKDDLYVTTSWWTTWAVRESVGTQQIVYLLQEDERMFYSHGDERLRCQEVLADKDVRFVVNTKLLFDHFVGTGLDSVARNGDWFEPAFPREHYFYEDRSSQTVRNLFFYARPHNARNLYLRGLEVLNKALESGILDPAKWRLYFVGKDLKPVQLAMNVRPRLLQNLTWDRYVACVRKMDLGLALMDTPHPSYPPLDLAACGAVVVTNKHGVKQTLDRYSRNILCGETSVDGLVSTLMEAVALVESPERRINYLQNGLLTDWRDSFHRVFDGVARRVVSVADRPRSRCSQDAA